MALTNSFFVLALLLLCAVTMQSAVFARSLRGARSESTADVGSASADTTSTATSESNDNGMEDDSSDDDGSSSEDSMIGDSSDDSSGGDGSSSTDGARTGPAVVDPNPAIVEPTVEPTTEPDKDRPPGATMP